MYIGDLHLWKYGKQKSRQLSLGMGTSEGQPSQLENSKLPQAAVIKQMEYCETDTGIIPTNTKNY